MVEKLTDRIKQKNDAIKGKRTVPIETLAAASKGMIEVRKSGD